jgi:DNA-directed RNA polymerase specialized sigma24 family protein
MKRCFNQRFKPYIFEIAITKTLLQHKLSSGTQPAIELLYGRYGGMLFSFVLQFIPDRQQAEDLLVDIFQKLTTQLQEACKSPLSVYCWMQQEARKIILDQIRASGNTNPDPSVRPSDPAGHPPEPIVKDIRQFPSSYINLLRRATEEQQWVFRELFLKGRQKEDLALQLSRDGAYIDRLIKESLDIIRAQIV